MVIDINYRFDLKLVSRRTFSSSVVQLIYNQIRINNTRFFHDWHMPILVKTFAENSSDYQEKLSQLLQWDTCLG